MRRATTIAVLLAGVTFWPMLASAQQVQKQGSESAAGQSGAGQAGQAGGSAAAASSGKEVTGLVTKIDQQTHAITIDGQEYVMVPTAGTAMMPSVGDRVSLNYREEGGKKVITRIGQAASGSQDKRS